MALINNSIKILILFIFSIFQSKNATLYACECEKHKINWNEITVPKDHILLNGVSVLKKKFTREILETYLLEKKSFGRADLRGINLSGLENTKFEGCILDNNQVRFLLTHGGSLEGVNLLETELNLEGISLSGVSFSKTLLNNLETHYLLRQEANLKGAKIYNGDFSHQHFHGVDFQQVVFVRGMFDGSSFKSSNFKEAKFQTDSFEGVGFEGSNFEGVKFICQNLKRTNFSGANLDGVLFLFTNFQNAQLNGASFRRAIIENTDFKGADMENANFENAQFKSVSLKNASLKGASFKGAIFNKTKGIFFPREWFMKLNSFF